jgi:hypothetical protein
MNSSMKRTLSMTRLVLVLLAGWISFTARAAEGQANGVVSALNSTTITGYVNTSDHWVADDSLPSVGVVAGRSTAWERPSSARVSRSAAFRFFRSGDLSTPLTVRYRLGGTARQAVDYTVSPDGGYRPLPAGVFMIHGTEPSRMVIPAGARSAILTIDPINDEAVEGFEKVQIQLVYPNPQFVWRIVGGNGGYRPLPAGGAMIHGMDSSLVIDPDHSIRAPTNAVPFVFEVRPDYALQRRHYPSRATIRIVDDDWGRWRSLR